VVVVPEPERESTEEMAAQPPERDLPWPEPIDEPDRRCVGLAASIDAKAAWMNPNMLRLELGTPPEDVIYASAEPVNLVGAKLRSQTMTRESAILFLDLSAFRIGVLANVPLTCGGETKRVRVMLMPNSGKLQYGNEFHLVKRDVP
jgi:hypothetical protein